MNILVTVSRDPSVDELSAALGLTVFLNALGKHATAVFSGKIPPAIGFLEPSDTFEGTVDSLRDFIIALDKEKADHLRYKVVDDAVKIFITPYRTTISESDLEFSQGDYNVELVLALNVVDNEHLDAALAAHGRILHDATVTTVTSGEVRSTLGTTDWHHAKASGVSEMLAELVEELKTPKVVLDEQMATAFLTGIVSATERFSNDLTSSRVMTTAANLMAAGANQQLIATRLQEARQQEEKAAREAAEAEAAAKQAEKARDAKDKQGDDTEDEAAHKKGRVILKKKKDGDGALSIRHGKAGNLDEVARQTRAEQQDEAARAAQAHLAKQMAGQQDQAKPDEESPVTIALEPTSSKSAAANGDVSDDDSDDAGKPSATSGTGGTTEPAPLPKPSMIKPLGDTPAPPNDSTEGRLPILSHGGYTIGQTPSFGDQPLNAAMGPSDEPPRIDPFAKPPTGARASHPAAPTDEVLISALTEDTTALAVPAISSGVSEDKLADAAKVKKKSAVDAAKPAPTLAEIEAQAGRVTPSMPMPDFSTLPPLPPAPVGIDDSTLSTLSMQPPAPAADFNPTQFQIPGQKNK